MSGNVRAFFVNKEQPAEDNLIGQVTVADVKMREMIAELNLPLATADSLTSNLIGRVLANFHYYYGFVVYTSYVVSHTVSVAWILS